MHSELGLATLELANFLQRALPTFSSEWWKVHVVDRLSFQQQRIVVERGQSSLQQLDLAALLRIFDQNWYELSQKLTLPREARNWIKELQTIRNKWAHLSAESSPPSEIYRDADTLSRLLNVISASTQSIEAVEKVKSLALMSMSGAQPEVTQISPVVPGDDSHPKIASPGMFNAGDIVALRSDPATQLPILEVLTGGAEVRYRVFQNGSKAIFYESQLQAPHDAGSTADLISTEELNARMTALQLLSPSTSSLFSMRSGRVNFVPYQYRPVLKLLRSDCRCPLIPGQFLTG